MLFRLLHFLGIVFWVGSVLAVALTAARADTSSPSGFAALRRTSLAVTTPAMLLSFVGGLGMLLPRFSEVYARAGWMHGKLTLLLILAGLTGAVSGRVRRASEGQEIETAGFNKLAIAVGLVGVVIVVLAVLRPGG